MKITNENSEYTKDILEKEQKNLLSLETELKNLNNFQEKVILSNIEEKKTSILEEMLKIKKTDMFIIIASILVTILSFSWAVMFELNAINILFTIICPFFSVIIFYQRYNEKELSTLKFEKVKTEDGGLDGSFVLRREVFGLYIKLKIVNFKEYKIEQIKSSEIEYMEEKSKSVQ